MLSSHGAHARPTSPAVRWRARTSALAAIVLCAGLVAGVAAQNSSHASAAGRISGVKTDNGPSGATSFGSWRVKPVGLAHAFAPGGTWANIELAPTWLKYWAPYKSSMLVSLPMLPSSQYATLAQGATGAYDYHFKAAAQHLVAAGMGNATLRVGWELNGGWFKWSAKSNPSAFAAYWRHIVNTMRSVSGQSFRFVWSVSNGYFGWDPRTAWPGNSYVTYVGVGMYDCWWQHPGATPAQRWNSLVYPKNSPQGGLAFWQSFAASKGKPVTFPEWGLVNATAHMCGGSGGGGDDTYFIQQMYNWEVNHNVAWETYFNEDPSDGQHRLQDSQFSHAASLYKKLFGGA